MTIGSTLSPFIDPVSWMSITIQGVTWGPNTTGGYVEVRRSARHYKIDQKNGPGLDGAKQTYQGKRPQPFDLMFYMWTDPQYLAWTTYAKLFDYSGVKGTVLPVSVSYPALTLLGISALLCQHVGAVEKISPELMFGAKVEVLEYLPPPPLSATVSPAGALTVSATTIVGNAVDPALVALQKRRDALAAQVANNAVPGALPP